MTNSNKLSADTKDIIGFDNELNAIIKSDVDVLLKVRDLTLLLERLEDLRHYQFYKSIDLDDMIKEVIGTIYGIISINSDKEYIKLSK